MRRLRVRSVVLVLAFSALAFLVMGYHPGFEDDSVYLAAVKHDLNPTLYPFDARFFTTQLQATAFDKIVATSLRITGISVAWGELLWQLASIVLTLWAAWLIVRQLFASEAAQWAGVALLGSMFTLPVAGTALYIADQHLHPRNLATGIILLAVSRMMAGRHWQAILLLLLAFMLHPIMGAMGFSFGFFLFLSGRDWTRKQAVAPEVSDGLSKTTAGFVPLGWIFEPPTDVWRKALSTRTYYFLFQWQWYEWLGALGPLALFWLLGHLARKHGDRTMARFAGAVLAYGIFQQAIAMLMTGPEIFIRLIPLQPMRYLQLVYIFMALIAGGLLGQYLLKSKIWRWAVFLLIVNSGMFWSQRELLAGSPHLELPGQHTSNPWLQAFAWIRTNTPNDAYFVLDPRYMAAPGEDYHSFRALAERSVLSDAIKDAAVTTQVPELAGIWFDQQQAQTGFAQFKLHDFERLKDRYGVTWTLVNLPAAAGLECPWHNSVLAVCRIP